MATITGPTARPVVQRNTWGVVSYLFMRLSGLALVFLVLIHFGIQHIVYDVYTDDLAFVASRWAHLGWRIYDAFLLALGLVHGLNGLRIVTNDYVLNRTANQVIKYLIILVGAALIVAGSVALIGGVRQI